MKPAYTDVKLCIPILGAMMHHMYMSGRRRHLLISLWAQDALVNVLVRQQVQLHDPPAAGSHFYTLHCAKYAALQPCWCRKMLNLRCGRHKRNTGTE